MRAKGVFLIADFIGYGGTKSYFLLLADYLIKKQKPLQIILESRQALTDQEYTRFKQAGVKINYLPGFLLSKKKILTIFRINKLFQFFFLLIAVNGPYEKVIVSTGHSFYFLTGAWIWGKKFYYIQHTYPQGSPSGFTKYISGLRAAWYSLMAKRGFTFITVSRESKRIIQDFLTLSDIKFPVSVVYNTCDASPCAQGTSDSKTVVTIGHLEKWKNPEFWLQVALSVANQNDEVSFVWAGTGSLMEEISKKIPVVLQSRILLAGYVANVSELLSAAAIYFQPSLVESQGISAAEAMAHSLPCVVSNRGGLPEAVEDGITGYVIDLDVEQASQKLLYLIRYKEVANRMGKAGYGKYEREYSVSGWEKKMDQLLFNSSEA
jgi:glycosyltransferase involved in cell wall biosynthesis